MLLERVLECNQEFLLAKELDLSLTGIVIWQYLDVHETARTARDISEMRVQAVTVHDQAPNKRAVGCIPVFYGYS